MINLPNTEPFGNGKAKKVGPNACTDGRTGENSSIQSCVSASNARLVSNCEESRSGTGGGSGGAGQGSGDAGQGSNFYEGVYTWDSSRAVLTREADGLHLQRRDSTRPQPHAPYYLHDLTHDWFVSTVYLDTPSTYPEFEYQKVRYGILHPEGSEVAKIGVIHRRRRRGGRTRR